MPLTLVLGGTRSGKSSHARKLAVESNREVVFLATANPLDDEMEQRIRKHREKRPDDWDVLEPEYDLLEVTKRFNGEDKTLVLWDDVSLWISKRMEDDRAESPLDILDEWNQLRSATNTPWILVSGLSNKGVVPRQENVRRYLDVLGRVNQTLAKEANRVIEVKAGLPIKLKN